ncbi:MAG: hypothetical protein L3J51_05045 [Cocleimonas sp.]|nr:hypothetical protein [Cocleimonas sp.]
MLKINEEQMEVFSNVQYTLLKQKIDEVLSREVLLWKKVSTNRKQKLLEFFIIEAEKYDLRHDDAIIYFSVICMAAKEGYQSFLKRQDVIRILYDDSLSEGGEIILLSNIADVNIRSITL